MLVPVPHAIVDEDAVVVQPRHAALADSAVFRARRLEQPAGPAFLARVEDGEVIRVQRHVARVRLRRDDARVSECRQVEKHVGQDGRDGAGDLVGAAHARPCARQVQKLADGQQQDIKDQYGRMTPVPDVMAECAPRGDNAAACKNSVKRQDAVRYVHPYCSMQPSYRSVSSAEGDVSVALLSSDLLRHPGCAVPYSAALCGEPVMGYRR